MALLSGPAPGSWINAAARQAWSDAGKRYAGAATRVEQSAHAAAGKHLVAPLAASLRQAGHADVGAAVGTFTEGEQVYYGLPDAHPLAPAASNLEYGTETAQPVPLLRQTRWAQGGAARRGFEQYLWEGVPE